MKCHACQQDMDAIGFMHETCQRHPWEIVHNYNLDRLLLSLTFHINQVYECTWYMNNTGYINANILLIYIRGKEMIYQGPPPTDFNYYSAPKFLKRLLDMKAFL